MSEATEILENVITIADSLLGRTRFAPELPYLELAKHIRVRPMSELQSSETRLRVVLGESEESRFGSASPGSPDPFLPLALHEVCRPLSEH